MKTTKKVRKSKSLNVADLCCERFGEAYTEGEVSYAYENSNNIDETEWFIDTLWHLYYCPFCGAFIKGQGFGTYDKTHPPRKGQKRYRNLHNQAL
jgi:hypothetical protein